ncbi:erythromycin esterase family protein [soil metagenome]
MKYYILFTCFLIIGCTKTEKKIANQVIPVNLDSQYAFEHIGNIVADKEIVILGESQHGDGRTLELKSHLLKYLVEEKGFNTIAFEGRGFIDMEILNNDTPLDSLSKSFSKDLLLTWYAEEQMDMLDVAILNNKLNFIGLESGSDVFYLNPDLYIDYLREFLEKNYEFSEFEQWPRLKKINYNIGLNKSDDITEADIDFYSQYLTSIIDEIERQSKAVNSKNIEKDIILNSIKNAAKYAVLFKNRWLYDDKINFPVYNNLRDNQMAENLFWHKERNPEAKIIVWTANFHGAKKIRDIRYKEEDSTLYNNYILLGEHLHKKYGDLLYSIAFTSSSGESAMLNQEPNVIIAPKGSLEKEIEKRNIDYGFIDFSAIRKSNPELINSKFNAIILGHDSKPGKWLNVFDGIFYIKKNEKIVSAN